MKSVQTKSRIQVNPKKIVVVPCSSFDTGYDVKLVSYGKDDQSFEISAVLSKDKNTRCAKLFYSFLVER